MKTMLRQKITQALEKLGAEGYPDFVVEEPRDPDHGHLATNVALVSAKSLKKSPVVLADLIMAEIDTSDGYIESMSKAGPGFINFTLSNAWWGRSLNALLAHGDNYGRGEAKDCRVMVEYVSANPTGPLHVGHGRGAAIGDALVRIMTWAGYDVSAEYYINDAGRQMSTLGQSVYARIKELAGGTEAFPENHYCGDYIIDLAKEIYEQNPDILKLPPKEASAELTVYAQKEILEGIKADLRDFKVHHDNWFSELTLHQDGAVEAALADLKAQGFLYEEEGALWFNTADLGDDKNRVLIKSDGEKTYFAADIAYHWHKYQRGFDLLVNVLGADHHGYIPRLKAAAKAMGRDADSLTVVLVQLVSLVRDGKPVSMSTRGGEFITLKEVVDEVGSDAARFIFLMRSPDTPVEFDLELAKTQSKDNPVYYVQYVGARISSILRAAQETAPNADETTDLTLLCEAEEIALIKHLASFPELVQNAAHRREPHHLTSYLTTLARLFHHYYAMHRVVADDKALAAARLSLVRAVRLVVRLGLNLLGVNSPEVM